MCRACIRMQDDPSLSLMSRKWVQLLVLTTREAVQWIEWQRQVRPDDPRPLVDPIR
jgi:hypothetical protein